MEEYKKVLCFLEERLTQNDENRILIQREMEEVCSKVEGEADSLEERINGEIHKAFDPREERVFHITEMLNNYDDEEGEETKECEEKEEETKEGEEKERRSIEFIIKFMAEEELSTELKYELKHYKWAESFSSKYKLIVSPVPAKGEPAPTNTQDTASRIESTVGRLQEHLDRMNEAMTAANEEIGGICAERRKEAEELRNKINEKLESLFTKEDSRIQELVKELREMIYNGSPEELKELATKAKRALSTAQKYVFIKPSSFIKGRLKDNYDLMAIEDTSLKHLDFEARKPTDFAASFTDGGEVSISFSFPSDDAGILEELSILFNVRISVREEGQSEEDGITLSREYPFGSAEPIRFKDVFMPSTTYYLKMHIEFCESHTEWSDEIEFVTPEFKECCAWRECPDEVDEKRKYSVDEKNSRVATDIGIDLIGNSVILGSVFLPNNKVTSWSIKILKSKKNNGHGIFVGATPFDMDQNRDNFNKCGWYFDCFGSTLCSGPPHNYRSKEYGPRKEKGQYAHTGDSVGVVMDTAKGNLAFILNGANLGVAYEGIPLDKPLVPCVILGYKGDSVELDTSEVKENLDSSIPVPSNITTTSTTWDSITLTWDAVGGASFYQIEVDGSKFCETSATSTFTKRGFLAETEHAFRIRAVKGNSVSEWSDVVKGKTQEESFETSGWKECPDYVDDQKKYSIDARNSRIITMIGDGDLCTAIGNIPLPLNKVTSWSIKVLKSKYNIGSGIYIGVAPSGINQNKYNLYSCGWYFDCWRSVLRSGPPHNYRWKEYGPRKERNGEYVRTGDSVGVVMDTAKGELSFVLDGVNRGVAYEGIPLDKPLVPCVLLNCEWDSVELVI